MLVNCWSWYVCWKVAAMSSENIIRECILSDGLIAVVHDVTSHYYGGYYHVRLQVTAEVPLRSNWFGSESEYADAHNRLGSMVVFKRTLEKMAVPATDVDVVKSGLVESFETNVLPYLSRSDFSSRFVLSEYEKACKAAVTRVYCRS